MKKYKVKPGCKVEENGNIYEEGRALVLPEYRAEQLGLDKLEEVIETPAAADDSANAEIAALKEEYSKLKTEYNKEKDYSKSLGEKSDAQAAEIEKLNGLLEKANGDLEAASAEIEKLKKKNK